MAEPKSEEDSWKEKGVEEDRFCVEETELIAEGEFGEVDGEVEPGACANHDHFGGALGKEVESGDGACGVGQHSGDSSGPAAEKSE